MPELSLKKARKLAQCAASGMGRRGLRNGVGLGVEHLEMLSGVPVETLIDVGANRGQFSLATRKAHPECRVHAFEPLEDEAETYRRVFAGQAGVTLYGCALGSEAGETVINVTKRKDSSSLLPVSDRQTEIFPGTEKASERVIQIARLDDIVPAEDCAGQTLLKIDVQGFELEVLKGAAGLLRQIDHVYVECSFVELYSGQPLQDEVKAYLEAQGFQHDRVFNQEHDADGAPVQADFLFKRAPA
ncbi:MAG: FkbM family methyltransferase [Pseudomonadota bacterium]